MKLRIIGLKSSQEKSYKVEEGKFFINGVDQELETLTDKSVASYDVSDNEDYSYITRDEETKEVTVGVILYVSQATKKSVFTIQNFKDSKSDALFPYSREDGKLIMEADLESLEGMVW